MTDEWGTHRSIDAKDRQQSSAVNTECRVGVNTNSNRYRLRCDYTSGEENWLKVLDKCWRKPSVLDCTDSEPNLNPKKSDSLILSTKMWMRNFTHTSLESTTLSAALKSCSDRLVFIESIGCLRNWWLARVNTGLNAIQCTPRAVFARRLLHYWTWLSGILVLQVHYWLVFLTKLIRRVCAKNRKNGIREF